MSTKPQSDEDWETHNWSAEEARKVNWKTARGPDPQEHTGIHYLGTWAPYCKACQWERIKGEPVEVE